VVPDIGEPAALLDAEDVPGPAQLEVLERNLKTSPDVNRGRNGFEALECSRVARNAPGIENVGIRMTLRPTYAPRSWYS